MRGAKAPTAQRSAGGVPHRADLATVWLHLDDRDALNEARHCAPMPAARPRPGDQLLLVWRRPARPPAHPATACPTGPGLARPSWMDHNPTGRLRRSRSVTARALAHSGSPSVLTLEVISLI